MLQCLSTKPMVKYKYIYKAVTLEIYCCILNISLNALGDKVQLPVKRAGICTNFLSH